MFTMLCHDQRRWLLPDLIAGLTLSAFLVPTGMGYATASGLPVAHGLYASIAALVAYFVCGPSRILVLGPDSALAPLVAAAVAAGPVAEAPARAAVLAILSGLLCLLAAVLRLGILTDLISKPVRIGYLNGIAITVIIGQLPTLLGITPPDGLPRGLSFAGDVVVVTDGVWHHRIDIASVALGVCVFLAIMIANHSANRSFRAGVELLAGKANLEVRGPLDETLFPALAAIPGITAATPVVQGILTLPDHPGEYLRLLGVDPFTNPPFETFRMVWPDGAPVDVEDWLRERDAIALTREFARKLGLEQGDLLRVNANGRTADLRVRFVLQPDDPAALARELDRISRRASATVRTRRIP
jgi:hypothetical protein